MLRCSTNFSAAVSCPRAVAIAVVTSSVSMCSPGKLGYSSSLRRRRSELKAVNGPANWARTASLTATGHTVGASTGQLGHHRPQPLRIQPLSQQHCLFYFGGQHRDLFALTG